MRAVLLAVVVSPALAATCCWSKWGDKSSCGNYPAGGSGAICGNDGVTVCQSSSDCTGTPSPPPSPGPGPTPSPVPTPSPTAAGLSMHSLFTDGMVLSAKQFEPAKLWGSATPGAKVELALGSGETATVVADTSTGRWQVALPAAASTTPTTLTVSSSADAPLTFQDVLVGAVWLCSGQSNMGFGVATMYNGTGTRADAENHPDIRLYTVPKREATKPVAELGEGKRGEAIWVRPTSNSVAYFSAVCYVSALEMKRTHPVLANVPLGLIQSAVGGTPIDAWMPTAALAACGEPTSTSAANCGGTHNSVLFNGMIHNLAPFTLYGAMWYQGEANVGCKYDYSCAFPAMISSWRELFQSDFQFLFVQLAAYDDADHTSQKRSGDALPKLRQDQMAALKLKGVAAALAVDRGDNANSCKPTLHADLQGYPGGIHPCNKSAVARRMALALLDVQGFESHKGPTLVSAAVDGDHVTLTFEHASDATLLDTEACSLCCARDTPFELEVDGVYTLVQPVIEGPGRVALPIPNGASIVSNVRYAWQGFPQCVYSNSDDLTMAPFTHQLDQGSLIA